MHMNFSIIYNGEGRMNKNFWLPLFLMALITLFGSETCFAQQKTEHPAPDVDGYVWMQSTDDEKRAFLFGAGSLVVLEYHIRDKHGEKPSRFVKGWVDVLKDMSWAEMAKKIDTYYKNHPDNRKRYVFEVIWDDMIKPNLQQ